MERNLIIEEAVEDLTDCIDPQNVRKILTTLLTKHEDAVLERGRLSVLQDFDNMCKADAFIGFTPEEWKAVQKFFEFNAEISGWKKELKSTTDPLRANQSDHEQTN